MKKLEVNQMENVQGGGWLEGVGCAAGVGLVVLSVAPTGINIVAFATGVGAIHDYCDKI